MGRFGRISPHKTKHQAGGADEIDISGLTPADHASRHQDGGADEISIAGLSGLAADQQTPLQHSTDKHDSAVLDTVAKLLAQNIRQTPNRLAGIVPTFDTFDTDPSSPANMTDGDWTTESGEGVKTLSANGWIGNIKFDMGAIYPVLIVAHINAHRDSGDGEIYMSVWSSPDGANYYFSGTYSQCGVVVVAYKPFVSAFTYARYFRIRLNSSGTSVASVYHVKVAEVMAIQLI